MRTTYSFKTHDICPDTGCILDVLCEITTSDVISVYDLLAENRRITAEPVRRLIFTEKLGRFCEQHAKSGTIKSSWSDYDGLVFDFEISCQYEGQLQLRRCSPPLTRPGHHPTAGRPQRRAAPHCQVTPRSLARWPPRR